MRRKLTMGTALALCFTMAAGFTTAAEREVDHQAARSKQRLINGDLPNGGRGAIDMSQSFNEGANRSAVARVGASALNVSKATALISDAQSKEGVEAVDQVLRALELLPVEAAGAEADKVRFVAYVTLADNYTAPAKQATMLNMALEYTNDPATRARIESQIAATGGEVVDLELLQSQGQTGRTSGFADTCLEAEPFAVGSTISVTIDVAGEHDWFSVDINEADGGALISAFTTTDGATFSDDTDLGLFSDCDGTLIAFNDDFGGDFTSRIDSACLPNGTYFVEVGGWSNAVTVDSVDFTVEIAESCVPPTPDAFEPDDDRENASRIGRLVSGNPFGLFKGTIRKEIQAHNFFPSPDVDFVKYLIIRNELVQMETNCRFPTVFNDFAGCDDGVTPGDTVLSLLTDSPENYGGFCNDQAAGFVDSCLEDLDCDFNDNGDPFDDLADPVGGFPACIPVQFFQAAPATSSVASSIRCSPRTTTVVREPLLS